MECNIDAKGKAVRLISGLTAVALGLALAACWLTGLTAGLWPIITAAALLAMGGFQVFEARTGWCVVRAMGIKTKI